MAAEDLHGRVLFAIDVSTHLNDAGNNADFLDPDWSTCVFDCVWHMSSSASLISPSYALFSLAAIPCTRTGRFTQIQAVSRPSTWSVHRFSHARLLPTCRLSHRRLCDRHPQRRHGSVSHHHSRTGMCISPMPMYLALLIGGRCSGKPACPGGKSSNWSCFSAVVSSSWPPEFCAAC